MEGYKFAIWVVIYMVYYISSSNGCLEEERIGLLGLRELLESNGADSTNHLLDWGTHTDCCEWERVTCDPTSGHVTELFLPNLRDIRNEFDAFYIRDDVWTINCSLFLPFRELRTLNLSSNSFGQWDNKHGFGRLSALKKLEKIDISSNKFDNIAIFKSLGAITSLKALLLHDNGFGGSFPTRDLVGLGNLEMLDLSHNGFDNWLPKQGFEKLSVFMKLETLNLGHNLFTVRLLPFLNSLTSLKVLSLCGNRFGVSFPAQELGDLKNLESLDLSANDITGIQGLESLARFKKLTSLDVSYNMFNISFFVSLSPMTSLKNLFLAGNLVNDQFPARELSFLKNLEMLDLTFNGLSSLTVEDCELLSNLNKMRHLDLTYNYFDKDVFRILGALPSLRFLSLSFNLLEGPISNQDLTYNVSNLEVLHLVKNSLNGSLPMEGFASLRFLEVLDLRGNSFYGNIPSSIGKLSSLKVLSLASNKLSGPLPDQGFCELRKLEELDLTNNLLKGILPPCLSNLKSIRFLDLSMNYFTGNLSSSLISSISLEYINLNHNLFEGTISLSLLANHSKLVGFEIASDNGKLVVETEDVDWFPMFQLKVLNLSNCNLNKLSNKILPKFLIHQHELQEVDLSANNLNDSFPDWLLVNNTGLDIFKAHSNSFFGTFHLPSIQNIGILDLSDNHITGKIQANIGNMLPMVWYLNLSNNAFEGSIPSSFGVMRTIETLDLSSNHLSGEVPWRLLGNCSYLQSLLLTNNSLHGQIFSADFNFTQLWSLQVGDNRFTGPLSTSFLGSGLMYLDVSNNHLSGEVSGEFSISYIIILRNNSFNGEFPCALVPREFMDVSYNSFSGPISSCSNQNLEIVKHLHLQGNNFTGQIPQFLLNSSALLTLDISDNRFCGTFPMFLAPSPELRILLSRGNLLNGSIPSHLCLLNKMSLMDISNNHFTGSIPRCLSNISFGITVGLGVPFVPVLINSNYISAIYQYKGILTYSFQNRGQYFLYSKTEEVNFVTKSFTYSYQGNILNYMSGLDLSNNKLTGEIPMEIGYLTAIRALNLSRNNLIGPIPKTLSYLTQVESLDLSHNNLIGNIPFELTNLNSLEVFSVANNNLSGRIPYGKAQFGTFNASDYEGNPGLCGLPLAKSCDTQNDPRGSLDERESKWFGVDRGVVAAFGIAYITFFVGTLTVLYINPNWLNRCTDLLEEGFYSSYFFFSKLCR